MADHREAARPSAASAGPSAGDPDQTSYAGLVGSIVDVVGRARREVERRASSTQAAVYWFIGRRIVEVEQGGAVRAEYGAELLDSLARDLTARLGRGFSRQSLGQMRQFYVLWPTGPIRQTLSVESGATGGAGDVAAEIRQTLSGESQDAQVRPVPVFPLPWSAYVRLTTVKSDAAREFYETEALRNGWTVRQLGRQIDTQFYERTAMSTDKAAMLSRPSSEVADVELGSAAAAFRDPFVLEFLDLKDEYSESDLEGALIARLADFLLELGDDFAFLGRQRRLRLDDTWFRVDLVFYHRVLRSLVLIDLKRGRFSYQDAGQMHLYLNYARENWVKAGENPPVGLILCAEKGADEARYALDGLPGVLAAEYRLALPDEAVLVEEIARTRRELESRGREQI